MEKYCRAGQATDYSIIWRMRFACWVTKATDTHPEYLILIAFRQQQRLRERTSVSRYNTLPVVLADTSCLLSQPSTFPEP